MKLQIDTEKKTIKLESNVELKTLVNTLERLLPKGEWKSFTLETNTVIQNWSHPIHIHDHHDHWPWYRDTHIMYAQTKGNSNNLLGSAKTEFTNNMVAKQTDNAMLTKGIFNVQM